MYKQIIIKNADVINTLLIWEFRSKVSAVRSLYYNKLYMLSLVEAKEIVEYFIDGSKGRHIVNAFEMLNGNVEFYMENDYV